MVLVEITFKSGSRKTVHCDKFDWRYSSEGGEIISYIACNVKNYQNFYINVKEVESIFVKEIEDENN